MAPHDFGVIIGKTNRAEAEHGKDGQEHEGIGKVSPKERGDERGGHDQNAAHCGRAGFGLMAGRAFLANELLDLHLLTQTPNGPRAGLWSLRNRAEKAGPSAVRTVM